jgi:hypothetical protein
LDRTISNVDGECLRFNGIRVGEGGK